MAKWMTTVSDTISKLVPRAGGACNASNTLKAINAGKAVSSDSLLESFGNSMVGGIRDTLTAGGKGLSLKSALKVGYKNGNDIMWGRVAGTVSTGAIGYRFLSGGGIYRDKNGNFDVAGVPFI